MNPAEITPKMASMMSPADRKALGVLTPEQRAAKVEAQTEAPLQKLCEQELSRRGIVYLHLSFRAREKIGWPDLTFVISGRPYAVELKTARGVVTPEQTDTLQRMSANGWRCHVCRSFERFVEIINADGGDNGGII